MLTLLVLQLAGWNIQWSKTVVSPVQSLYHLGFVTNMFLAFGLALETPVAVVLLVKLGAVTVVQLRAARRYVIVGAFIVGAIFTPPDAVSQTLLAVPLWLLYELGIIAARVLGVTAQQPAAEVRADSAPKQD